MSFPAPPQGGIKLSVGIKRSLAGNQILCHHSPPSARLEGGAPLTIGTRARALAAAHSLLVPEGKGVSRGWGGGIPQTADSTPASARSHRGHRILDQFCHRSALEFVYIKTKSTDALTMGGYIQSRDRATQRERCGIRIAEIARRPFPMPIPSASRWRAAAYSVYIISNIIHRRSSRVPARGSRAGAPGSARSSIKPRRIPCGRFFRVSDSPRGRRYAIQLHNKSRRHALYDTRLRAQPTVTSTSCMPCTASEPSACPTASAVA